MLKPNIEDSIQDQILKVFIEELKKDKNFSHMSSDNWREISKLNDLADDQILLRLIDPLDRS